MDKDVILAIIGLFQAVTITGLGLIAKRLGTVKNDAKATKDQIVNHHPEQPNFREENDKRHNETKRWFMNLSTRLNGVENQMIEGFKAIQIQWNELSNWALENRERIENIEDTQNTRKAE